ncbi:unnamed protein product [Boreogadus saida]
MSYEDLADGCGSVPGGRRERLRHNGHRPNAPSDLICAPERIAGGTMTLFEQVRDEGTRQELEQQLVSAAGSSFRLYLLIHRTSVST